MLYFPTPNGFIISPNEMILATIENIIKTFGLLL